MWPAIISALDNTLVIRKHNPKTRAKIQGILKQLRSYKYLCLCCCYLDILENISPVSKVFEEDGIIPSDIKESVKITTNHLEDQINALENEEDWDSHLHRFTVIEHDGVKQITSYVQYGDMLKKPANRKHTKIILEDFTDVDEESESHARNEKVKVSKQLLETFVDRLSSFNDEIHPHH